MLNAVIIDDQRINATMLQELIHQFCSNVIILCSCTSIEEGYQMITKYRPDIVFLDVELTDDDTGFDLLSMFKPVFFKTIFITAHRNYAVEAFRENATDYLLKPINVRQLQIAIAKVQHSIQLEEKKAELLYHPVETRISIPTQEGYLFVYSNEILYGEASGSYTNFYFVDERKITISMHLKECEAILPQTTFCRIHNSYIVNKNFVVRYIRGRVGTVVLTNNVQLEVSASRKDTFLQFIRKV